MRLLLAIFLTGMALAQTARFPGAVATDRDLKVLKNKPQTTLSAPLNASATTVNVVSGALFVPNMLVSIDSEILSVCAVNGAVLTIGHSACPNIDGRGFDGSTAASHSSGALVSGYAMAWNWNAPNAEIKAIETALGANLENVRAASQVMNYASNYDFGAQTPGGSLAAGNNAVTLTPVPDGVNGTDTAHWLYISGGTGTPEACLITGGAGVAGDASGQVILQCAGAHSGAWTVASATGGIQEALIALGAGGGTVQLGVGTYTLHSALTIPSEVELTGVGTTSVIQLAADVWPNANSGPMYVGGAVHTPVGITTTEAAANVVMRDFTFDMNGANQSSGFAGSDIGPADCANCTIERIKLLAGHHNGIGIGFLGSLGYGNRAINNTIIAYGGAVTTCTGGLFSQNRMTLFMGNYITGTCDESVVFNGASGSDGYSIGDTVRVQTSAGVTFHAEGASQVSFIGDTCMGNAGICFGASPITGGADMRDIHFIDVAVEPDGAALPTTGILLRSGAGFQLYDIEISGGHITGNAGAAVLNDGTGTTGPGSIHRLSVTGMTMRGVGYGVWLSSDVAGAIIKDNRVTGATLEMFHTSNASDVILGPNLTDDSNDTITYTPAFDGAMTIGKHTGGAYSTLTPLVLNGLLRLGVNVDPNNCTALRDGTKAGYCVDFDSYHDLISFGRRSTAGVSAVLMTISNNGVQPVPRAFASLGAVPPAGFMVYCTDCTTAATCAGSGSGHMAVSNGSGWTCQ